MCKNTSIGIYIYICEYIGACDLKTMKWFHMLFSQALKPYIIYPVVISRQVDVFFVSGGYEYITFACFGDERFFVGKNLRKVTSIFVNFRRETSFYVGKPISTSISVDFFSVFFMFFRFFSIQINHYLINLISLNRCLVF